MYFEDFDYDDCNEFNEKGEYTQEIIQENLLDSKVSIVNYYKNILINDPDFIGIKNLSDIMFLYIIENTNDIINPISRIEKRKQHEITQEQHIIFIELFNELNINYNKNKLQNIINKILKIIYV